MTVVIAPSRRLRCLLAGFGASLLAAACAAGFAACAAPSRVGVFTAGPAVALALTIAGACVLHAALRPATAHRIDISGVGQLRLTVQQGMRTDACEALPVRLLPGSTLWPRMMLLRMETVHGVTAEATPEHLGGRGRWRMLMRQGTVCRTVAVLPDSMSPEAFRALAVALGRGGGATGVSSSTHKIL